MKSHSTERITSALGLLEPLELFAKTRSLKLAFPNLIQLSLDRLLNHGERTSYLDRAEKMPLLSAQELEAALIQSSWSARLDRDAPLAPIAGAAELASAETSLRSLLPWKKGPFQFDNNGASVHLDAEWQCYKKWQRLTTLFDEFSGARVLDIGSGNGYFMLRALGKGAICALGVEPAVHHVAQFMSLRRAFPLAGFGLLPLRAEDLPENCAAFDVVLSMGVLYHRRSPLDHILQLKSALAPGGKLILETIVTEGPEGHALLPCGRYAQMRNVFFLPSVKTLLTWVKRCGLNIIAVDEPCATHFEEQRRTQWMPKPSLVDFLDPSNSALTIEGHPAPKRVIIVAEQTKMPNA